MRAPLGLDADLLDRCRLFYDIWFGQNLLIDTGNVDIKKTKNATQYVQKFWFAAGCLKYREHFLLLNSIIIPVLKEVSHREYYYTENLKDPDIIDGNEDEYNSIESSIRRKEIKIKLNLETKFKFEDINIEDLIAVSISLDQGIRNVLRIEETQKVVETHSNIFNQHTGISKQKCDALALRIAIEIITRDEEIANFAISAFPSLCFVSLILRHNNKFNESLLFLERLEIYSMLKDRNNSNPAIATLIRRFQTETKKSFLRHRMREYFTEKIGKYKKRCIHVPYLYSIPEDIKFSLLEELSVNRSEEGKCNYVIKSINSIVDNICSNWVSEFLSLTLNLKELNPESEIPNDINISPINQISDGLLDPCYMSLIKQFAYRLNCALNEVKTNTVIISYSGGVDSTAVMILCSKSKLLGLIPSTVRFIAVSACYMNTGFWETKEDIQFNNHNPIINFNKNKNSPEEILLGLVSHAFRIPHHIYKVTIERPVNRENNFRKEREEWEILTRKLRFAAYDYLHDMMIEDENLCDNFIYSDIPKVSLVIIGHHSDDGDENTIEQLTRGHLLETDMVGMMILRPAVHDLSDKLYLFRPLLDIRKCEIIDFVSHFNIPYFVDNTPSWSTRGIIRRRLHGMTTTDISLFNTLLRDLKILLSPLNDLIKDSDGCCFSKWRKLNMEIHSEKDNSLFEDCGFIACDISIAFGMGSESSNKLINLFDELLRKYESVAEMWNALSISIESKSVLFMPQHEIEKLVMSLILREGFRILKIVWRKKAIEHVMTEISTFIKLSLKYKTEIKEIFGMDNGEESRFPLNNKMNNKMNSHRKQSKNSSRHGGVCENIGYSIYWFNGLTDEFKKIPVLVLYHTNNCMKNKRGVIRDTLNGIYGMLGNSI